jgi:hypothetical protein
MSIDARNKVGGFVLPKSHNFDIIFQMLNQFKEFFSKMDQECLKMVEDLMNILSGNKCKREYQNMKFNG